MKSITPLIASLILFCILLTSCKKKSTTTTEHFTSVADFLSKNAPLMQSYSIDADAGGNITTPQGTVITIPPNDFKLSSGILATGNVTVEFKDIYKKSDMLLCDVSTDFNGRPLKSAGEFFIRAKAGDSLIQIVNKIDVQQPANGNIDTAMKPFVGLLNAGTPINWAIDPISTETFSSNSDYVFSLYTFSSPAATGTWCNSDCTNYFAAYPITQLALTYSNNIAISSINVFLIFKNVNSMVHVYESGTSSTFPYFYAPLGLDCTVVALGIDGSGNLDASFTPITIGNNQVVNFSLAPSTQSDFTTRLSALN